MPELGYAYHLLGAADAVLRTQMSHPVYEDGALSAMGERWWNKEGVDDHGVNFDGGLMPLPWKGAHCLRRPVIIDPVSAIDFHPKTRYVFPNDLPILCYLKASTPFSLTDQRMPFGKRCTPLR